MKDLNLYRFRLESNFWQYFNCITKGHLIDFEIEKKNVVFLKGLNLLLGPLWFPNNKYSLIITTTWGVYYLRGGPGFSIRGRGWIKRARPFLETLSIPSRMTGRLPFEMWALRWRGISTGALERLPRLPLVLFPTCEIAPTCPNTISHRGKGWWVNEGQSLPWKWSITCFWHANETWGILQRTNKNGQDIGWHQLAGTGARLGYSKSEGWCDAQHAWIMNM